MEIFIYLGIILVLCYILLRKHQNYFKNRGIPYEEPFLFFGSFFKVALQKEHILHRFANIYTKYKNHPYVGFFMFMKPTIMVNDPELLKKILVKDFEKFVNRSMAVDENIDPIMFHTLFSSKGKNWRGLRNKLSPVFTSGKMKLMMPLMQECGEVFIDVLNKQNGKTVDIQSLTKKYAIDVISSTAFGVHAYCLKDADLEFSRVAIKLIDTSSLARNLALFSYFFIPVFVKIFRLTFADKSATDYLMQVFKNTIKEREENKIVRNDLIDMLNGMRKNEKIGDDFIFDDIRMAAQAIGFFGAGYETTSMTISYTLYELAQNKEAQNRLRAELRNTFEEKKGFTYESIQDMKYLGMVINETLRKYPLTTFLNRETLYDYVMEDGKVIEKGTSIMIPVCGFHYDPNYFPNPLKYDPERFNDENKANIPSGVYMPFGEGPRNCIGQRFGLLASKICVAYLVKDFEFDITKDTVIPIKYNTNSIFLTSKGAISLKVTKV